MDKNTDKENKKAEFIKKQELINQEKLSILAKADEIKEQTLDFDAEGNIYLKKELQDMMLDPIDNPQEKYDLYYKVLRKLLRDHFPKGLSNKKARDYVYEEINTFLTMGYRKNEKGIRGADGRMAYIPNLHELINIVIEWIGANGTMIDIYTKIRDRNVELGYGKPLLEK